MNIAIIGGGWVGCHLTKKLKNKHNVVLFEKNNMLFSETSFNNQNRLHLGYHYARSSKTRKLCEETFDSFLNDYKFLTKEIKNNYYCVPKEKSIIDYETFLHIFEEFNYKKVELNLKSIDGCINTNEMYIDFEKSKSFFNDELKENFVQKTITPKDLNTLSKEYDLVINSTNNILKDSEVKKSFYELTVTLIYEKLKQTEFEAITLVDGDFFSIYPYKENFYTVTDVKHTPLKKFKSNKQIYKNLNENVNIERIKGNIEKNILNYFPDFKKYFKYNNYFLSIKSKVESGSDNRYPIITKKQNIVNCFTGKIQGIYIIEDYVNNLIKEKNENISR